MEIRNAVESDAQSISHLIYKASMQYNFSETQPCPQWFIESICADKIKELIKSSSYTWFVAVESAQIIGILAASEMKFIKYCFVHPNFHRRGVAKSIWDRLRPSLQSDVTVRSSIFAIPFYQNLGFNKVGNIKFFNGLSYQLMTANLQEI